MITCEQVNRTFHGPGGEVRGLGDVSFTVARGEFVAVQGASGSGKSTLLLTLGGMMRPSSGRVVVNGHELYALPAAERGRVRAAGIGFVFQLFHLVPYLTVLENVLAGLPGSVDSAGRTRAAALLDEFGLSPRAVHKPATLSAGERQRTALARAILKQPAVILADEPTGNLDPENTAAVFRHLAAYQERGGTVMVVTHGQDAAPLASRTFRLEQGRLTELQTQAVSR
jgi:putative ABC transport system ATP-binding protein